MFLRNRSWLFRTILYFLVFGVAVTLLTLGQLVRVASALNRLDTNHGRKAHFEEHQRSRLIANARELIKMQDVNRLQAKAASFESQPDAGQFFIDDTSGIVIVNRLSEFMGRTNGDIGGSTWEKEFQRVKQLALKNPDRFFDLDYFTNPGNNAPRYGIGYYDSSRGWIFGRVVSDKYFLSEKNRLLSNFRFTAFLATGIFLLSLLLLAYLLYRYARRDQQFREYELALNTSNTAVALMSADSRITFANDAFRRSFTDQFLGKKLLDVSTHPNIRTLFEQCLRSGHASYRNTGRSRGAPLSSSVVLTRYDAGAEAKVMMVITDITEIVEAYRAVAHDMKNPLPASLLAIDNALLELEQGQLPHENVLPLLQAIHDRIVACQSYALYLGAWGREEVNSPVEVSEPTDVSRLLHRLSELFACSFATHQVDAIFDVAPGLSLRTEERSLEAVLRNLITNAIEAFDDAQGRQITVTAKAKGGDLIIDVADNAHGMTEKRRENLYSEDIAMIAGGARIVMYYARRMGGKAFVTQSILGQGTTVRLQIPLDHPAPKN